MNDQQKLEQRIASEAALSGPDHPLFGHATAAREGLGALADTLADPRPVRVRGVAWRGFS